MHRSGGAVAVVTALLVTACAGDTPDPRVSCSRWTAGPNPAVTDAAAIIAFARASFVARDGRHLVYRATDGRVWVRRTSTGEERQIALADDASIYAGTVDAGRLVAFTSRARDNYHEFFTVDLETCSSRELGIRVSTSDVTIGYSELSALAVAGDRLFCSISRGSLQDSLNFVLELPSVDRRDAPAHPQVVYAAAMGADRVVWLQSGSDGSTALATWNLGDDTMRTHAIPSDATGLAASGGRVVWTDQRDTLRRQEHLFLLDTDSDVERRVSMQSSRQTDPSVRGHLVAWADDRTGRFAIRLLDLDTGAEREVAAATDGDLRWPTLTDAGLFWVAPGSDGSIVYLDPTIRP